MPTTDKSVLLPLEVHQKLKMKATMAGMSMREYLIKLIDPEEEINRAPETENP
jgi:hypothetical protein